MYVVGAIVIAILLWKAGLDINYSLVVFGLGVAMQSIPARFRILDTPKKAKGITRDEAEKWMREEGYLGATREILEGERIAKVKMSDPPEGMYYDENWNLHKL